MQHQRCQFSQEVSTRSFHSMELSTNFDVLNLSRFLLEHVLLRYPNKFRSVNKIYLQRNRCQIKIIQNRIRRLLHLSRRINSLTHFIQTLLLLPNITLLQSRFLTLFLSHHVREVGNSYLKDLLKSLLLVQHLLAAPRHSLQ